MSIMIQAYIKKKTNQIQQIGKVWEELEVELL